jgi:TolA-binding protein
MQPLLHKNKMKLISTLALMLGASFISDCFAAPSVAEAPALLEKSDNSGAEATIGTAFQKNFIDPYTTLLYARSLSDANKAISLYKKIVADKFSADSLRSEAYFRLGCALYLKGRFQKASGFFINAAGVSGKSRDLEACYLNAVHDTLDTSFLATLQKAAGDTALTSSKTANFYLGIYFYAKKEFSRALSHFNASIGASEDMPWKCCAYAGAYCCSAELSRSQEAADILALIKRNWPVYLEHTLVDKTKINPPTTVKKDSASPKDTTAWLTPDSTQKKEPVSSKPLPSMQSSGFSLQVGSFSTMENAQALKTSLKNDFPSVEITQGTVGNKTVFRVRVGVFKSRDAAQTLGDSTLVKKGIAFKVIEE